MSQCIAKCKNNIRCKNITNSSLKTCNKHRSKTYNGSGGGHNQRAELVVNLLLDFLKEPKYMNIKLLTEDIIPLVNAYDQIDSNNDTDLVETYRIKLLNQMCLPLTLKSDIYHDYNYCDNYIFEHMRDQLRTILDQ